MIGRLGDYARAYAAFWRACLAAELEFRANFLVMSATSILWSLASLALIAIVYRNVRAVGDWNEERMWLLTGTFLLSTGLANMFIARNMDQFSTLINRGELDFVLARPLNSQFVVSTRYLDLKQAPAVLFALVVVARAAQAAGVVADPAALLLYGVLLLAGLVIVYALWFMSVTLAVFVGRLNNIAFLMHAMLDLARVPTEVYGPVIGRLLTLVIPFAFVATVPASALLGLVAWSLAAYGIGVAAALLIGSHYLWQFALRHYSSASS